MSAFDQSLHSDDDPFFSGDSHTLKVHVTDDGTDNGTDKDISNFDIIWKLFDSSGSAVIEKDNTGNNGGISITNASGGLFSVTLDPSDTDDISGWYEWEAEGTSPGGEVQTLADGDVNIKEDQI